MTADQDRGPGEEQLSNERPQKYPSAIDGRLPSELLARLAVTLNADKKSVEEGETQAEAADADD
ncbi:hypothetical protein ACWDZ8_21265 [Streptomyces sp. NPDC003233]